MELNLFLIAVSRRASPPPPPSFTLGDHLVDWCHQSLFTSKHLRDVCSCRHLFRINRYSFLFFLFSFFIVLSFFYLYLSIHLSLSLYIYIYICVCVCVCVCARVNIFLSFCGGRYVNGCLQSCDDGDGCNRAPAPLMTPTTALFISALSAAIFR